MRFKLFVPIFVLVSLFSMTAYAGSLDSLAPPDDPASASFTLEDLWNRMNAGTAGSKIIFTQPATGPTVGSGHTINEIMDKTGVDIFGVGGSLVHQIINLYTLVETRYALSLHWSYI